MGHSSLSKLWDPIRSGPKRYWQLSWRSSTGGSCDHEHMAAPGGWQRRSSAAAQRQRCWSCTARPRRTSSTRPRTSCWCPRSSSRAPRRSRSLRLSVLPRAARRCTVLCVPCCPCDAMRIAEMASSMPVCRTWHRGAQVRADAAHRAALRRAAGGARDGRAGRHRA